MDWGKTTHGVTKIQDNKAFPDEPAEKQEAAEEEFAQPMV